MLAECVGLLEAGNQTELKIKCLHGWVEPCLSVLSESYFLNFHHLR